MSACDVGQLRHTSGLVSYIAHPSGWYWEQGVGMYATNLCSRFTSLIPCSSTQRVASAYTGFTSNTTY